MTIKPSIRNWTTFYKSSAYAVKAWSEGGPDSPREVCSVFTDELNRQQWRLIAGQKSAEGIVGHIV